MCKKWLVSYPTAIVWTVWWTDKICMCMCVCVWSRVCEAWNLYNFWGPLRKIKQNYIRKWIFI